MTDIAYHPARLKAVRDQFRALRAAEFPWTADTVYLNNASTGPIPERTRRALDEFTAQRTAPHLLPDRELQAGLQAARAAVAQLINAEASEIALATNTSHGLNLAARAPPLQPRPSRRIPLPAVRSFSGNRILMASFFMKPSRLPVEATALPVLTFRPCFKPAVILSLLRAAVVELFLGLVTVCQT